MSVKVTKKGTEADEKYYLFLCDKCNSEWEANKEDISFETDFRNGTLISSDCPMCEYKAYSKTKI